MSLGYEFYLYARVFTQNDTQFCSLCCRITKIGIVNGSLILWYRFCQEKRVLTTALHTGASLLCMEFLPQDKRHSAMLQRVVEQVCYIGEDKL